MAFTGKNTNKKSRVDLESQGNLYLDWCRISSINSMEDFLLYQVVPFLKRQTRDLPSSCQGCPSLESEGYHQTFRSVPKMEESSPW